MCPVEKLGIFSGKLVSGVVLRVKVELILMLYSGFRQELLTS